MATCDYPGRVKIRRKTKNEIMQDIEYWKCIGATTKVIYYLMVNLWRDLANGGLKRLANRLEKLRLKFFDFRFDELENAMCDYVYKSRYRVPNEALFFIMGAPDTSDEDIVTLTHDDDYVYIRLKYYHFEERKVMD